MAKIVAGNDGVRELEVGHGGVRIPRVKGGFEVPDKAAKQLAEAAGGFVAGIYISSGGTPEPNGPWCKHDLRPFYCEDPDCKDD